MESPPLKRSSQFTLRLVFAIVTVVALVMAPASYYYRARSKRPDAFVTATLLIGDQSDTLPQDVDSLAAGALLQRVLDEPRVRGMSSICNTSDSKQWLSNHLTVRAIHNTSRFEVVAHGRREQVSTSDLKLLLDATIDVILADAARDGIRFTVISTGEFSSGAQ